MNFFRKNPLFALGLVVCGLLVLAELGLIYERFTASREAATKLAQRQGDLGSMAVLMPPPNREVAAAIEGDLAKAQQALVVMQGELKGRGPAAERIRAAKVPVARTDAYFDLATFVEKTREAALNNEIEIRPEAARFGFGAYANEGPVADHIEPVFRQRQLAQYLLDALIEARPRAILAVKRERTLGKADRDARAAALANNDPLPEPTSGEEGPDLFTIDPRVTARVPGFIDTQPFRFVFTGQTAALRTFLNRLASFELPVLVREVEVEPATNEEAVAQAATEEATGAIADGAASVVLTPAPKPKVAPKAATPRAASGPVMLPIVSKPLSKYTVTVEFIELVSPPVASAADAATPAPSS
ncbi:MAG: hypothetical protein ABIQ12_03780 [Opitutaceae bacterium]